MVAPNIEGTYQLVRRELPDGTVQFPPAMKGMITYTKEFRNFSVVWKDDQGRFYSECYVARYTLTDQEYAETSEYLIVDDQIGCRQHPRQGSLARSGGGAVRRPRRRRHGRRGWRGRRTRTAGRFRAGTDVRP